MIDSLDWDLILQPFSDEAPCGADVQYDAAYDAIRRLRQAAQDNNLPSGVWEKESKKVDWNDIARQCYTILTQRSKDLQVAAWLVEALAQSSRLPGMTLGLSLFTELQTTYWDQIYPRIEDKDVEMRLRPTEWLLRESLKWVKDDDVFGPEALQQGEQWQTAIAYFAQLRTFIDEKLPMDVPNFRDIDAALQAKARISGTSIPSSPVIATITDTPMTSSSNGPTFSSQAVNSREVAYEQLKNIAAFLSRTEPHSPVPMILEALIEWRDANFIDLLKRLPKDGGGSVYELLRLFKASD